MRTADFDFDLPEDRIAQFPIQERDQSRLLVIHRETQRIEHRKFRDLIEHLRSGDVVVLNDSRVIPARLRGSNAESGGAFEMLLLEPGDHNEWWVLLRPGKRARAGTRILIHDAHGRASGIEATVLAANEEGHRRLRFSGTPDIVAELHRLGEVPLPPYISRTNASLADVDRDRYQTVYARHVGSVAAPTAGLHFTEHVLEQVRARGARTAFVTLHVGLGTFAPVKVETLAAHHMHEEHYKLTPDTAHLIENAKRSGGRVVAVGTTSLRVLESVAATHDGLLLPGNGQTRLFIHPPYRFRVVDALLTNFHLPRSTLLMLVSAFAQPGGNAGRDVVLKAYAEAIREGYRFFSYGDAMFIQ